MSLFIVLLHDDQSFHHEIPSSENGQHHSWELFPQGEEALGPQEVSSVRGRACK